MFRQSLLVLFVFALSTPTLLLAKSPHEALERVAAANDRTQPGLQNYLVTIETSRTAEMMPDATSDIPSEIKPLAPPILTKFWQRDGKSLVSARQTGQTTPLDKIIEELSANLTVELNERLLPGAQAKQRRTLLNGANIKSSEVALTDNLIQRLEITFEKPTDLGEAFYVSGMRLPQKQIKSLIFDIDNRKNTVSELSLVADGGLQLSVEIRYLEVAGGYIPERFQTTSPDGKVDDLFEIKFVEVDSYLLPASMLRVTRSPEIQERLEIFFKGYQVNQPIPLDIKARLENKEQE